MRSNSKEGQALAEGVGSASRTLLDVCGSSVRPFREAFDGEPGWMYDAHPARTCSLPRPLPSPMQLSANVLSPASFVYSAAITQQCSVLVRSETPASLFAMPRGLLQATRSSLVTSIATCGLASSIHRSMPLHCSTSNRLTSSARFYSLYTSRSIATKLLLA
ncbi:hypothetical protein C8Q77DRAFT_911414 [Trametes polyzona]|nr:hypothetical protein C8Q77DRAFT_911414 [Trametes polyzona]